MDRDFAKRLESRMGYFFLVHLFILRHRKSWGLAERKSPSRLHIVCKDPTVGLEPMTSEIVT